MTKTQSRLVLFCLGMVVSQQCWALKPFTVITDIDDTTKPRLSSHYGGLGQFGNIFLWTETFTGMLELYQGLAKSSQRKLQFVSGSPAFLNLEGAFNSLGFPKADYHFRSFNPLYFQPVGPFKAETLQEMDAPEKGPYLLIGDNIDQDPRVYTDFKESIGSNRVLAIYIHHYFNTPLPEGTEGILYYTSFDLALHELEAGRLQEKAVLKVGKAILQGKDRPDLLFPPGSYCPPSFHLELGPKAKRSLKLRSMSQQIEEQVREICSQDPENLSPEDEF